MHFFWYVTSDRGQIEFLRSGIAWLNANHEERMQGFATIRVHNLALEFGWLDGGGHGVALVKYVNEKREQVKVLLKVD